MTMLNENQRTFLLCSLALVFCLVLIGLMSGIH